MDYDPTIIRRYASELYRRADGIVIATTIMGGVIGLILGYVLGAVMHGGGVFAIIVAVIGAAIGYNIGQQRAFALRLEAQLALCQVQIEQNTHR